MISFFRNFPRHVKEAYHGLSRNAVMTLSSASAVTVTLLLIGCFLILAFNIQSFTESVENDVKIHVRIDDTVSEEDIPALQKKIASIANVSEISYSNRDEELELMIESFGEDGELFGGYRGEGNPLKRAFVVRVSSGEVIDTVTQQIENTDGILGALYGGNNILKMMDAIGSIRSGGIIFVIILTTLAIFLISNTIKIAIFARQSEISIMRLVGASNSFIRTPYLFEGMIIGILGSIIPIGLVCFGYDFLYKVMAGIFFSEMFPLITPYPFILQIAALMLLASVAVGLVGSFIAVSRYLWWKR